MAKLKSCTVCTPQCIRRCPIVEKRSIARKSVPCPECGHKFVTNCPKCGNAVPAGAKFCLECGEKL